MSLQLFGTQVFMANPRGLANLSTSTLTISSTTIAYANIVVADTTGSIDRIVLRIGSITTNASITVSIQTVNTTTGAPTGTVLASGVLGTVATGFNQITLSSSASLTAGTRYAIVVAWTSTAGSFTITSQSQNLVAGARALGQSSALVWSDPGNAGVVGIYARYTSGLYMTNMAMPISTFDTEPNYNLNSTPDEYALKWTPAQAYRLIGATFFGNFPFGTAYQLVYYDATGTEITSVKAFQEANSAVCPILYFDTPQIVTAGSPCRISLRPSVASSISACYDTYRDADAISSSALPGAVMSSRTNLGSWTDSTTFQQLRLIPIVDAVDVSGGGSSSIRRIGMDGGF